ncbi:MAG: PAS domain S-box protein [Gemmataceae bacterium]
MAPAAPDNGPPRNADDKALRDIAARYRSILDTANEGIWILDRNLQISYVNRRMAEMLGHHAHEMIGRTPYDFMHEADRRDAEQYLERRRRGISEQVDFRYQKKDGSTLWAIVCSTPTFDDDGHFDGVLAMLTDITERKLTEQKLWASNQTLQAVIKACPLAINIIDPLGNVILWNDASARIFGWSEAEVVGRPLPTVPGDRIDEFRAIIAGVLAGENCAALEVRRQHKDGALLDIQLWTTPLHDAGGKIMGILAILADITEQNRLQREFLHAQKMEAVGRLAGGVAHDFNNLLTVISGYSELLLASLPGADPLRDIIVDMQKAEDRAIGLTRQLLTFSRKQVFEPKVVDLNAIVANMDKMLRRLIGEDIQLITEWNPEIGRVKVDPGQIEQIILNLAVNARDAMPHGGKLTLSTDNVELDAEFAARHRVRPGPFTRLAIADTGCGMDADTLLHIYEPFFTTKEAGKGTGLGLATIYGIVQQTGGLIQVTSQPEAGTQFEVYFPRVEAPANQETVHVTAPPAVRGREVVLLVEDEDVLRDFVRKALERAGFQVLEASHGLDALRLVEQDKKPIDILLSDVILPHMNGPEVYQRLQVELPALKVLYMTGYMSDVIEPLGIRDGDSLVLHKPFLTTDLLKKVREVLDGLGVPAKSTHGPR